MKKNQIGLVHFFNWLKVVKNIEIMLPHEFLNQHIKNRATQDSETRRWALHLAFDHSKTNSTKKQTTAPCTHNQPHPDTPTCTQISKGLNHTKTARSPTSATENFIKLYKTPTKSTQYRIITFQT
jgi:hypothetical protein